MSGELIMYDSTTAADIPADVAAVAGYVDHRLYTWSAADWARFPSAIKVRIAVNPWTNDGDALDVEQGDATPAQAPGWVRMRRAAGHPAPACYVNRANWGATAQAFDQAQLARPPWWVATLDGTQLALAGGVIACQYANSDLSGGHYDLSIVDPGWTASIMGGVGVLQPDDIAAIVAALNTYDKDKNPLPGRINGLYQQWVTDGIGPPAEQQGALVKYLVGSFASIQKAIAAIPGGGGNLEPSILAAVNRLGDEVAALSKHLGTGTP